MAQKYTTPGNLVKSDRYSVPVLKESWENSVTDYYVSQLVSDVDYSQIVDGEGNPDTEAAEKVKNLVEESTRKNIKLLQEIIKTYCEAFIATYEVRHGGEGSANFQGLDEIVEDGDSFGFTSF